MSRTIGGGSEISFRIGLRLWKHKSIKTAGAIFFLSDLDCSLPESYIYSSDRIRSIRAHGITLRNTRFMLFFFFLFSFCLRDDVLLQISVAPPKFGTNCLTYFLASLSEFNLALSHYGSIGGDVIREDQVRKLNTD